MQVPACFLDISSSWVLRSLHAKFQLPRLPRSGSSMVPAEAEVGTVTKADPKKTFPKNKACSQRNL